MSMLVSRPAELDRDVSAMANGAKSTFDQRYLASASFWPRFRSRSLSPTASSMSLVKYRSPRFSPWYSKMLVSTMESTGQLFAEAAEDALGQVDVVARRTAAAVGAHVALDGDGHRRADRFAELAGDAALFPVLVAAQCVQAAKARRQWRLFFRELDGDVARQEVPAR